MVESAEEGVPDAVVLKPSSRRSAEEDKQGTTGKRERRSREGMDPREIPAEMGHLLNLDSMITVMGYPFAVPDVKLKP